MLRVSIGVFLIACSAPARPPAPAPRSNRVAPRVTAPPSTPSIEAGWCHACRLDTDGALACWGCNSDGQLGDGTLEDRATPVRVRGIGEVAQVALGATSTCALEVGGRVACWGDNDHLQLGGTHTDTLLPWFVPNIRDAVRITVGKSAACALEQGGALRCWGENRYWDTGSADYGDQAAIRIDGSLGIDVADVRVDAGNNGCVLDRAGVVTCWGGDLGNWSTQVPPDATNEERMQEFSLRGSPIVRASGIRAFLDHAATVCVLPWSADAGAWECLGRTGDPQKDARAKRGQIAIGGSGGCAASGGKVSCWGRADDPMLGAGVIDALDDVAQVAVGAGFACALRDGGAIACWGDRANWRTGDDAMALLPDTPPPPENAPRRDVDAAPPPEPDCRIATSRKVECRARGKWRAVARVHDVVQLTHGDAHVCARSDEGAVWCWGAYYYDSYQHDGEYTQVPRPHRIRGVTAMVIASWGERDCAITTSHALLCWGRGLSEVLDPVYLRSFEGPAGRTRLVIDDNQLCAWAPGKDREPAQCWGTNHLLQYRDHSTEQVALEGIAELQLAGGRGCARHGAGTVTCWGDAVPGDGTWSGERGATQVDAIEDATAIAVGPHHACALRATGEVWCWGENDHGELGDGTTHDRVTPVRATYADGKGTIASIAVTSDSTSITTTAGETWIWGD